MPIYLDTETYSSVDLKKTGVYACAERGRVICIAIAIDNDPVEVFDTFNNRVLDVLPKKYIDALFHSDEIIYAVNAQFDRVFLKHGADKCDIPVHRWRCVSVMGWMAGLPGSLETLGALCKLSEDQAKSKAGRALMKLFSFTESEGTPDTHPVEWRDYMEYCRQDVASMRRVIAKLPRFNDKFWDQYHVDQTINDRGFFIDRSLVVKAMELVQRTSNEFDETIQDSTFGKVESVSKRDQILRILNDVMLDKPIPDLQSSTIDSYLTNHPNISAVARDILQARASGGAASVKKWTVLDNSLCRDGAIRGSLVYYGANRTGRWSGKGFQPQNLPRPNKKHGIIEADIEKLLNGVPSETFRNGVSCVEFAQNALRSAIIARQGKKLVVADLANIEGRVLSWIAGESWKIKAFYDYDAGEGPDLYKMAYAKAFRKNPADVDDNERQRGKVMELALGYMGGVGAFVTFAATYGINLDQLAKELQGNIPADVLEECARGWDWAKKQHRTQDLPEHIYKACDALKRMWRRAHPKTVELWDNIKMAVITADNNPGDVIWLDKIAFQVRNKFLIIALPSGRTLAYPGFQVTFDAFKTDDDYDAHIYNMMFRYHEFKGSAHHFQRTYAGKLTENIVQAIARDVLAQGLLNAEKAGMPVVLHVHDEIVCETPDHPEYSLEKLQDCMVLNIPWANELPLAAAGYEAYRYRK